MDPKQIEWWVVNLASRQDRLAHATGQFMRVGLPFRRFDAFTPDEWPGESSEVAGMRYGIPGVGGGTPGAIGCHQSQLHCVRTVQGTDRVVGVCEDDVSFCADFQQRLDHIAEFCRNHEWDIFWLGGTFHAPSDTHGWHKDSIGRDIDPTDDPRIVRTYGIWSTYAYLVNGQSVRKILDICKRHVHESIGIDYLAIKWLQPVLKTYCFVPGCVKQYDGRSNIGNGFTTFSHFANLGGHWYQDVMDQYDPAVLWEGQ